MANAPATALADIRTARRDMYRQQILNAAELEFATTGYAPTKMSAIAQRADVSLATIYKNFDGKQEIWDALHTERMSALLAAVERTAGTHEAGLERLLGSIATVARFLAEHPGYLDLNLHVGLNWAANPQDASTVDRTVWLAGLDMITAGVERAIARGEVREIRPRVAAGIVVSALQVWLADWVRSGRDRDPDVVVAEMERHLRWMLVGP